MKKFLLLFSALLAASPIVKAEELEFPTTFQVSFDVEGLTVTQGMNNNDGYYFIGVTGSSDRSKVAMTIATPEGWDGFYSLNATEFFNSTEDYAYAMRRAVEMGPIEDVTNQMPAVQSNTVNFKANGEDIEGWYFLYKGDEICSGPFIVVTFNVDYTGVATDPEFPASFGVNLSDDGLEVSQTSDSDFHNIFINGKTAADEVTVTLEVPEGWDGFVGKMGTMGGGVAYANRAPEWFPISDAYTEGFEKTNALTFPVTGNSAQGTFLLYKGDQVDVSKMIIVNFNATKDVETPDVEFPSSFDVTLSDNKLKIESDFDEQFGEYDIVITGESAEKEVTVTIAVPEEWDGFVYLIHEPEPVESDMRRLPALWFPIESLLNEGYVKGNSLTFPVDGQTYSAELNLYKGIMVDANNLIYLNFNASYLDGISTVGSESGAPRFYNLTGAEVKNPAPGIYVKVENGKTSKVIVK